MNADDVHYGPRLEDLDAARGAWESQNCVTALHAAAPLTPEAARAKAIAREQRGPWWWRARIFLVTVVGNLYCWLEPSDRGSVSWVEGLPGEEMLCIRTIRRPPADA